MARFLLMFSQNCEPYLESLKEIIYNASDVCGFLPKKFDDKLRNLDGASVIKIRIYNIKHLHRAGAISFRFTRPIVRLKTAGDSRKFK